MTSDLFIVERSGGACKVTLNRPDKANALTLDMVQRLRDLFRTLANDKEVRVLTITGAGERAFCAGADLSDLSAIQGDPANAGWEEMAEALYALPILTIACLNGACIGGGLTLALNCDIRLAVPEAVFAYPALRNTVLPGRRDRTRLDALIGPGRTALILLGAARIGAAEAAAWGLVDQVTARADLAGTAARLSETALTADAGHLAAMKQALREVGR